MNRLEIEFQLNILPWLRHSRITLKTEQTRIGQDTDAKHTHHIHHWKL